MKVGALLMKLIATASLLCCAMAPAYAFNPNDPAASGYSVALIDTFHSISPARWENNWWYATPTACQMAFLPGTVTATATGLVMHIESLEGVPACDGSGQTYSYAHLDSYRNFALSLGYFEASIKSSAERGTLTAFWLLPESGAWPPELDIEEIRGDFARLAYMTNHFGIQNEMKQYVFTAPKSLASAYHRYGALVTGSTITWYIDGVQRGRTKRQAGEAAKLFIVLSLYSGTCWDGWAGCPQKKKYWSADAFVQWVRVWAAPKGAYIPLKSGGAP
jgi:beta-glucanase (GH16 family)